MKRAVGGFLIWLAASLSAYASALTEITAACSADVIRLCTSDQINRAIRGDDGGIAACLRAHRKEASAACSATLRKWRH